MKSKKWLLGAGVTLSAALLLAACGKSEKNADAPKTFFLCLRYGSIIFGLQRDEQELNF